MLYPGLLRRLLFELLDRLFVLHELIRGDHGDAVPGADLVAKRAADAPGEIDGAGLEGGFMARAGNRADAVDGADDEAGFAAGTHVFVEQRKRFGEFLFRHDTSILGWKTPSRKRWLAGCGPEPIMPINRGIVKVLWSP